MNRRESCRDDGLFAGFAAVEDTDARGYRVGPSTRRRASFMFRSAHSSAPNLPTSVRWNWCNWRCRRSG